jgi:serine/threonine-protein kinase
VCSALAEAHALGIIHRDLKPANIYVEPRAGGSDFVKVLDFGIAKIMKGSGIGDGSELTAMGQAVGTLEYMAPEQLMGGQCDGRTDIYTLGVVVYEVIAGRRPFSAVGFDLLTVQLTERAPPPSLFAQVPPGVDRVLLRCLEHDVAERFPDIEALSRALAEVTAAEGPDGRPSPALLPTLQMDLHAQPAPAPPVVRSRPETPPPPFARSRPETPPPPFGLEAPAPVAYGLPATPVARGRPDTRPPIPPSLAPRQLPPEPAARRWLLWIALLFALGSAVTAAIAFLS